MVVRGKFLRSTDGGHTWQGLFRGLDSPVRLVRFSPAYEADRTLFALHRGRGLSRSRDGGTHWSTVPVRAMLAATISAGASWPRPM